VVWKKTPLIYFCIDSLVHWSTYVNEIRFADVYLLQLPVQKLNLAVI